jgi:hypothetical protein
LINRAALILRYKAPAIHWINEADPHPSEHAVVLERVNKERTVYLIEDTAGDDSKSLERWLKRNYEGLFEIELEGWYTDPALWPQGRNYHMFQEWFAPECHTVIIDTGREDLFDDDA